MEQMARPPPLQWAIAPCRGGGPGGALWDTLDDTNNQNFFKILYWWFVFYDKMTHHVLKHCNFQLLTIISSICHRPLKLVIMGEIYPLSIYLSLISTSPKHTINNTLVCNLYQCPQECPVQSPLLCMGPLSRYFLIQSNVFIKAVF